jgi:hypothetical protein
MLRMDNDQIKALIPPIKTLILHEIINNLGLKRESRASIQNNERNSNART